MDFLRITYTHPLEREFESWIVSGIQERLEPLGFPTHIFAVSPFLESDWPADEALVVTGKLLGLQVKRPQVADRAKIRPNDFSRVNWDFAHPAGQWDLVTSFPEIHYCLPTFINREIQKCTLDHTLFWRPPRGSVVTPGRGWYANPRARRANAIADSAERWGGFLEGVMSCRIGVPVRNQNVIPLIKKRARLVMESMVGQKTPGYLYAVVVEMPIQS